MTNEKQGAPATEPSTDTEAFMKDLDAKSDEEWLDALHTTEQEWHVEAMEASAVDRFGEMWKKIYNDRHPSQTRYKVGDDQSQPPEENKPGPTVE